MNRIVVQVPSGERLEKFLVNLHKILPVGGAILDRAQAEYDDEEEGDEEKYASEKVADKAPRRKR